MDSLPLKAGGITFGCGCNVFFFLVHLLLNLGVSHLKKNSLLMDKRVMKADDFCLEFCCKS